MAELLIIGGMLLALAAGWGLCSLMTMAKFTDLESANAELARKLGTARATECRLRERIAEHVRDGLKEKEA